MRDKISHYLQQHLSGEVMTSKDALDYFSTDASILKIRPKVIVYPRNTNDVRKIARFTWQLAERGHVIPITARGKGTDQAGAALGEGITVVFPAHMNKILELDKEDVVVQPGINYAKLEQALHTHYRFLPPYPSSIEFSTVGGAIANNAAGEKSVKYGDTRRYTKGLSVVLANGELIETKRLSKRELSKKKGQTNLEGEIYRTLDGILTDEAHVVEKMQEVKVTKNSAGYALDKVKDSKGGFDLTPLFVGSQGTLGIITQASLTTEQYNPNTTLTVSFFDDIKKASEAVQKVKDVGASAVEIIDDHLLDFVKHNNPAQIPEILTDPFPKIVMLVEFDDINESTQRKKTKKAKKVFEEYAYEYQVTREEYEKDMLWRIRHFAASIVWQTVGSTKAVPFIEDGVVPPEMFEEYITKVTKLFSKHNLDIAIWGHAADGNLHLQPFLDLSSIGDRQRVFKIADDYYAMIKELGGSTSASHNDGRIRAPYLPGVYGQEVYDLFVKVKNIFDPYGVLNPGVKLELDKKAIHKLMRKEYSVEHLYDHMPRT